MNYLKLMASAASIAGLVIASPAAAETFNEREAQLPQAEKDQRLAAGEKIYYGDKRHGDVVRYNALLRELIVTTIIRPHGNAENTTTTRRFCADDGRPLRADDAGCFTSQVVGPVEFTHATNGNAKLSSALAGIIPGISNGLGFGIGNAIGSLIHNPCADGCGGTTTWNVNGGEGGEANAAAQNVTDVRNGVQVDSTVNLSGSSGCTTGLCPPAGGQYPATDTRPPAMHVAPGYKPGQ